MNEIVFTALEYQQDQSLRPAQYRYVGSVDEGWIIERDGVTWLQLGPGYVLIKSLYCGICSTDLARYRLPFALPQIIGHELVGEYHDATVVVEINASHAARGIDEHACEYCQSGLDIHCPSRMTLGIDRLPGGFAPWVLAPIHAVHFLPKSLSVLSGVLIEPFAAAIKAVEISPPAEGARVAVLGPRKLGMLIIAALDSYRKLHQMQFEIVAVMRHPKLKNMALELGADEVVFVSQDKQHEIKGKFDIVFDTTGSPAGFERAVMMAKQTVHLKSTHGKSVGGLDNLTSIVINEQSIIGFSTQKLLQLLATTDETSNNQALYVSPLLASHELIARLDDKCEVVASLDDIPAQLQFDVAIVTSVLEVNKLTQITTAQGQSLLKPTGTILVAALTTDSHKSDLLDKISRSRLQIVTSRCGSFATTLDILRQLPDLAEKLQTQLITQTMDVADLSKAMRLAGQSDKSIKVVVKTDGTRLF